MKNNPVYRREMTVRARSLRMPFLLLIFNGILAAVALLNMYSAVAQVRVSAVIQYSSFLQFYAFVATLEFLLLMFIMPALTSGSLSGERERGTLELLFTTKMQPAEIVIGKLLSALSQLLILVVSSLPVLLLTFVYGSIDFKDLGLLLLCYVTVAVFTGAIGIFSSSFMRRSTFSNVCTYGILLFVVVGTYMMNTFLLHVSELEVRSITASVGQTVPAADSGVFVYLLLLNPGITFTELLERQIAGGAGEFSVSRFLGARPDNFVTSHWILISLMIQLVTAALLIRLAVWFLDPAKNEKK